MPIGILGGGGGSGDGGGGGGGGGSVDITATARLRQETILAAGAVAAGSSASELTLTENIRAGEVWTIRAAGSPPAYWYLLTDDLLSRTAKSAAPTRSDSDSVTIKGHNPGDTSFGHETIFVWRSDEANKVWISFGRAGSETVRIDRNYIDVDADAEGGGGGSGVSGWIAPQDAYTADHLHKFLILYDQPHRIEADPHDGHGKMVGGTASPGTWITLSDDDFLGFYSHFSPPPDSELTSGKWYYDIYGAFVIRRVNGQDGYTGVTGTFTYDPFDDGEPWHEVTIGGEEVDLDFRGGVDHLRLAFNAVTAIGQVFANRGENDIIYASELVEETEGYTNYVPRVWRPDKAYMVFWGLGQTEALPADLVARSRTIGSAYRLRWHAEGPNEVLAGSNLGARVLGSAPANADVLSRGTPAVEEDIADNSFIELPGGPIGRNYELLIVWLSRSTRDVTLGGTTYCVSSGDDVPRLTEGSPYADRDPRNDPLGVRNEEDVAGQGMKFGPFHVGVVANEVCQITTIVEGIFRDTPENDGAQYAIVKEI